MLITGPHPSGCCLVTDSSTDDKNIFRIIIYVNVISVLMLAVKL